MFSNFWSAVCRVDFACLRDSICFLSFSISFLNRERFSFCLLLTRLFTRSTASSTDWYNCLLFPSSLSMVSLSEHWEEILFEFSSKSRIKFQRKCEKLTKKSKMDYDAGGWKDSIQDWVYKERMMWTCTLLRATIIRLPNRWMNNRIYKQPSRMKNPEWMKWTERWLMYLNHSQKQGKGDNSDVNPSAKTKDIFPSFFFSPTKDE